MTLPKFTAGQVGKLEFHHLNEAFERIERLDGNPALVTASGPVLGRTILVRITGQSGTGNSIRGSFEEVALSSVGSNTYFAVGGGVKSTVSGDSYGAPIVFPCSAVGSIVPVLGHIAANGKLYFRECSSPTLMRLGRINAAAQIGSSGKFIYTLVEVSIDNFNQGTFATVGSGLIFYALNGCEQPVDLNREIGVGTIYPLGGTAYRKPIKNGTVVSCMPSGSDYIFSIPNGYEFVCP